MDVWGKDAGVSVTVDGDAGQVGGNRNVIYSLQIEFIVI